jgi:hypothetical protein
VREVLKVKRLASSSFTYSQGAPSHAAQLLKTIYIADGFGCERPHFVRRWGCFDAVR